MANRREEKEARRAERERLEREREAAERRRQRTGYAVASVLVLATIAVVVFVLASSGGTSSKVPPKQAQTLSSAASAAGCTVRSFPSEGRDHVSGPVTYRTNPPTSGPHNPVPAPDGIYKSAPPKENYVHTLEHGRIELQYRPGASAATLAAVKSVFDADTNRMMLFPNNTGMPYEVAATAWTHLLGCPHYNARVPAALAAFRDAYRGRAPEQIP